MGEKRKDIKKVERGGERQRNRERPGPCLAITRALFSVTKIMTATGNGKVLMTGNDLTRGKRDTTAK